MPKPRRPQIPEAVQVAPDTARLEPAKRKDIAHEDKFVGNRAGRRAGNGHADLVYKQEVIAAGGSNWPVVTEIRVKYQLLRAGTNPNEIPTYEIYLDPSAFDAVIARPGICDSARKFAAGRQGQADPAPHARLLKLDGTGEKWDELLAQYGNHITRPRLATPGLFCSEHTTLCVHERDCTMNCVHDGEEERMN